MAGGMTPGRGAPIGERPLLAAPASPSSTVAAGAAVAGPGLQPRSRHVWVREPDGGRVAGLVVEQARGADGHWMVLVVAVIDLPGGGAYTRQGWLPANCVDALEGR